MGKTASVAMLAVKYANKSDEMKDFDFVFTVRLKYVEKHLSLPGLIVKQHDKSLNMSVKSEQYWRVKPNTRWLYYWTDMMNTKEEQIRK